MSKTNQNQRNGDAQTNAARSAKVIADTSSKLGLEAGIQTKKLDWDLAALLPNHVAGKAMALNRGVDTKGQPLTMPINGGYITSESLMIQQPTEQFLEFSVIPSTMITNRGYLNWRQIQVDGSSTKSLIAYLQEVGLLSLPHMKSALDVNSGRVAKALSTTLRSDNIRNHHVFNRLSFDGLFSSMMNDMIKTTKNEEKITDKGWLLYYTIMYFLLLRLGVVTEPFAPTSEKSRQLEGTYEDLEEEAYFQILDSRLPKVFETVDQRLKVDKYEKPLIKSICEETSRIISHLKAGWMTAMPAVEDQFQIFFTGLKYAILNGTERDEENGDQIIRESATLTNQFDEFLDNWTLVKIALTKDISKVDEMDSSKIYQRLGHIRETAELITNCLASPRFHVTSIQDVAKRVAIETVLSPTSNTPNVLTITEDIQSSQVPALIELENFSQSSVPTLSVGFSYNTSGKHVNELFNPNYIYPVSQLLSEFATSASYRNIENLNYETPTALIQVVSAEIIIAKAIALSSRLGWAQTKDGLQLKFTIHDLKALDPSYAEQIGHEITTICPLFAIVVAKGSDQPGMTETIDEPEILATMMQESVLSRSLDPMMYNLASIGSNSHPVITTSIPLRGYSDTYKYAKIQFSREALVTTKLPSSWNEEQKADYEALIKTLKVKAQFGHQWNRIRSAHLILLLESLSSSNDESILPTDAQKQLAAYTLANRLIESLMSESEIGSLLTAFRNNLWPGTTSAVKDDGTTLEDGVDELLRIRGLTLSSQSKLRRLIATSMFTITTEGFMANKGSDDIHNVITNFWKQNIALYGSPYSQKQS